MSMTLSISQNGPKLDELLSSNGGRVTALVGASRECEFDAPALDAALAAYEAGEYRFNRSYEDGSSQSLSFNVMPDRKVNERLTANIYSVSEEIARVTFSREYETQMEKSPTHLVFISALVQWQKLIYLIMCEKHGIEYDPAGKERFKVWPTDVRCCLPVLVRDEDSLVQDTVVFSYEKVDDGKWVVEAFSTVNSRLGFLARASVYSLDFPDYSGAGWSPKTGERAARRNKRRAARTRM